MDEALVKKLKLPNIGRIVVLEPPEGYLQAIGRTSADTALDSGADAAFDFVQVFARNSSDVERLAPVAIRAVKPEGLLWMCYPKGTSKMKSDINRDAGWQLLTEAGWEGVALVSVDDTWSSMRFRPLAATGRARVRPAERRAADGQPAVEVPGELRALLDTRPDAAAFSTHWLRLIRRSM